MLKSTVRMTYKGPLECVVNYTGPPIGLGDLYNSLRGSLYNSLRGTARVVCIKIRVRV